MTRSFVYDKKCFNVQFLAVGPEVVVIKELIWHECLQLLLVETFHGRVCGKHFISGKAAKLWDRYDPDLLSTQNPGQQ